MSSLFEHQIYQNIMYTSNRRHSIHIAWTQIRAYLKT